MLFPLQRISNFKSLISKSAKKMQTNSTIFRDKSSVEVQDNKLNYDNKKLSEMASSDHDHPLKSTDFSFSNLSVSEYNNEVNQITSEINTVALDWKSLRNVTSCACSTPFDQFSKKTHCWKCGNVFCCRCIDKTATLAGHNSGNPVPVCRPCFKSISQSP